MRKKEFFCIYLDYIAENGQVTKHEKIATVKSRGLAEVTRNFYMQFYNSLIQKEQENKRNLFITIL